jgi:capsular exopolysaccharide synthesis family protein
MSIPAIKELFKEKMNEFYSIKGQLLSVAGNRTIKTILVTSCYPNEGKSTTTLSISYALTDETDFKVLLIDGNFRAPVLHKYLNMERSPGFSDLFLSENETRISLKPTENESLVVIPNGSAVTNPIRILNEDIFKEKLDTLGEGFDYIITDGTSIFGFSDILITAKYFDGIILVVECERTRWEVVQEAKERLENVGGSILGVVLNKRNYYIPKAIYGKV